MAKPRKPRKVLKRFEREARQTSRALRRELRQIQTDKEFIAYGVNRLEALVGEMRTALGLPPRDAQTVINSLTALQTSRLRDGKGRFKRKS